MVVFIDSLNISNIRVCCWALHFLCSIRTSQTHEEIQESEMEYVTIHGKLTRDELIELEGWNDYDLHDYPVTDEESLDEFLETLREDDE